ncbi:MAG TPA: SIMPL domain-containing protein [Pirellulaceae bacterium]|nr:SIMPL domain-containing protein [Pirellulaceae bacterium]
MKSIASFLALAAALVAGVPSVSAQFGGLGGPGTITGTGVSQIERLPEVMRMRVVVTAKGSTLEEALAALKDKTEAANSQLSTLGAEKESVKLDPPQIAAESSDRRRQVEMMMAQRLRGGKRSAKKEETKQPVAVSTTLTAEWPLQSKTGEELLVAATALQDKIKAADLAGAKEASQLTPEEQEALEEMESQGYNPYGDQEAKPGEPIFLFVAAIAEADREKADAEAFQKARQHAARLAKAAGAGLGKLQSLAGAGQAGVDESEYANPYANVAAYRMLQAMQAGGQPDSESEAIGTTPAKVTYRVTMTAGFELTTP